MSTSTQVMIHQYVFILVTIVVKKLVYTLITGDMGSKAAQVTK